MQSTVTARCQRDKNPNSSVVAEAMKLLANSSFGYEFLDCSHHSITNETSDERTHAVINKCFWGLIPDQLYEVHLAKSEFELEQPVTVGFFILQYAKLRVLELYYIFFSKFCDTDSYDEMEMHTSSLQLALAENNYLIVYLVKKANVVTIMQQKL